jgi:hypothetical protein
MDDEYLDGTWVEFNGEVVSALEEYDEGLRRVKQQEEDEIRRQHEQIEAAYEKYEREQEQQRQLEADNEWVDIVETNDGLDTELRTFPDELEEPRWGVEEDVQRVEQAAKIAEGQLYLDESVEAGASWSNTDQEMSSDFQVPKKKKRPRERNKNASVGASAQPTPVQAPGPPPPASPTTVFINQPPGPPPSNKPLGPPPGPPPSPSPGPPPGPPHHPPPNQPTHANVPQPPAQTVATPPQANGSPSTKGSGPPTGVPLPIASTKVDDEPLYAPGLTNQREDLGGIGQIGVFSNDSQFSVRRIDSFTIALVFIFAVFSI